MKSTKSGSDPVKLFIYFLAELWTAAIARSFEERVGSASASFILGSTLLQARANQFSHAHAGQECILPKSLVQFIL
jgi:hypothetical protein